MDSPFAGRTTDPFLRNSSEIYDGQSGIEYLMAKAMPYLYVRVDQRIDCSCKGSISTLGDARCSRCFGSGFVATSLDIIPAYQPRIHSNTPEALTIAGWRSNNAVIFLTGRWAGLEQGGLIIEVGWDVPGPLVYEKGRIVDIYGIYQVRDTQYAGFSSITYEGVITVSLDERADDLRDILSLPPGELPPFRALPSPALRYPRQRLYDPRYLPPPPRRHGG